VCGTFVPGHQTCVLDFARCDRIRPGGIDGANPGAGFETETAHELKRGNNGQLTLAPDDVRGVSGTVLKIKEFPMIIAIRVILIAVMVVPILALLFAHWRGWISRYV
jgi:hypothetical protein